MKCLNEDCGEEVPSHSRDCVVCGADAGFPNVRHAMQEEETKLLDSRVQNVLGNENEDVVIKFGDAVKHSVAVLCRSYGLLQNLVSDDNSLYGTFYGLVKAETRLPENNSYDQIREAVDSIMFPFYKDHIRFAALSLDGMGLTNYGSCSVMFKNSSINNRASVFEENTISFFKNRSIVVGSKLPNGYRASWSERYKLAMAKIGDGLKKETPEDDFPSILMNNSNSDDPDFIEVHIYGSIHRKAIEKVTALKPTSKADKVILKSIEKKLKDIGATLEVIS